MPTMWSCIRGPSAIWITRRRWLGAWWVCAVCGYVTILLGGHLWVMLGFMGLKVVMQRE